MAGGFEWDSKSPWNKEKGKKRTRKSTPHTPQQLLLGQCLGSFWYLSKPEVFQQWLPYGNLTANNMFQLLTRHQHGSNSPVTSIDNQNWRRLRFAFTSLNLLLLAPGGRRFMADACAMSAMSHFSAKSVRLSVPEGDQRVGLGTSRAARRLSGTAG